MTGRRVLIPLRTQFMTLIPHTSGMTWDGFRMSASRSCCALPASMRGCAAYYFGGGSRCRTSGGGAR